MADSDIVLNVGFNQDDVDKEIDKLEKKMAKYNRSLELATKSVDELEKEYERINTNLEIEENLHGKNTKEVRSLKLELEDVNKKLQDEYAIMDSIKKKREETNSLYRQAHLDPASFSRNIKPSNSDKGEVLNIDSRGTDKLENNSKKATSAVSTLRDTVGQANQRISGFRSIIASTTNVLSGFIGRVVGLAKRVFIFSVITMAFRHMRSGIADVIKGNDQLSASLETIKFNLQVAFLPIYNAILPALQSLINGLARATSYIAAFFNTLLGSNIKQSQQAVRTFNAQRVSAENLSKSNRKLADSTRKMAGATKKANDQMNKQLAGFDELNNLSKDVSDDIDNLSNDLLNDQVPDNIAPDLQDTYSASPIIDFDTSQAEQSAGRFKEKLQPIIDSIKASLSDSFEKFKARIDFNPLMESLDNLKEKFAPFLGNIGSGLKWFLDNILAPLGAWVINDAAPAFLDMLAGAIDFLDSALSVAKEPLLWLWNNFLEPVAQWTGGVICETLSTLGQRLTDIGDWMRDNKEIIYDVGLVVGSFAAAWALVNGAIALWNIIGVIATAVTSGFSAAVAVLTSPITLVILAIGALIAIIVLVIKHWDDIKKAAEECWNSIVEVWNKVSQWFNENVVQPVSEFFTGMWDKIKKTFANVPEWFKNIFNKAYEGIKNVFSGVKKFFSGIWDKIKSIFTNIGSSVGSAIGGAFSKVINSVLEFAEKMINKFVSSVNSAISLINHIPGVNIPIIPEITLPRIPYLAQGAVIPPNREFLAVLGDQKRGTNIEAPLDTIKQALSEVMAEYSNDSEYTFIAQIDGRTLFKETVKQDQMFKKQSGRSAFVY